MSEIKNKEVDDALHMLLHCSLKDYKYKTQTEQFDIIHDYIKELEKENKKYKNEKKLILKDIKEWISCAKNEKFEDPKTHRQYWDMFETILRKIFTKYNTENMTDDDLKYNYYLEKENNNLILENEKYKEIIDKALKLRNDFAVNNLILIFKNNNLIDFMNNLVDILKEVK